MDRTPTTAGTRSSDGVALRAVVADGSTTVGAAPGSTGRGLDAQIVALPDTLRLRMELVARRAAGPDEALEPVLAVLVGDAEPAKLAAIAEAFRTNDALRDQWRRTYEILRA